MVQQPRIEQSYPAPEQLMPSVLHLVTQSDVELDALRREDQAETQAAADELNNPAPVSNYDLLKPMSVEQRKQHFAELAAEILRQPETD